MRARSISLHRFSVPGGSSVTGFSINTACYSRLKVALQNRLIFWKTIHTRLSNNRLVRPCSAAAIPSGTCSPLSCLLVHARCVVFAAVPMVISFPSRAVNHELSGCRVSALYEARKVSSFAARPQRSFTGGSFNNLPAKRANIQSTSAHSDRQSRQYCYPLHSRFLLICLAEEKRCSTC